MEYIRTEYLNDEQAEPIKYGEFKNKLPFANSILINARIISASYLTQGEDVKTVVEITVDIKELEVSYEPGDTIGVLPQNNHEEVEEIITLLGLKEDADRIVKIDVLKNTAKKNAAVPSHLPNVTTIRSLFENNLDIRAAPKKLFLQMLCKHTTDEAEKQQLQEICSNSTKYAEFVQRTPFLIEIIRKFRSCKPPLARLLEHLPSLKPRPYSISSSPLRDPHRISFVISVVKLNESFDGVCTSWLKTLIDRKLLDGEETSVPLYFRKPNSFRLPSDPTVPAVMVGPGTGVAPFVGFLRHRELQKIQDCAKTCLYFGCRYAERDFLYETELKRFLSVGVLNELNVALSREHANKTYVQNLVEKNDVKFVASLLNENAILYVCGDAKNMGKDVKSTVQRCIAKVKNVSEDEALDIVKMLQKDGKYVEDIWI